MADLTVKAFDLADKYRMPAMLLADGTLGQMMEPVEFPEISENTIDKPWAVNGTKMERKHNVINSLYLNPETLEKKNFERFEKYKQIEENECLWESFMMEDAEYCIVAFGIAARVSKNAIVAAREKGIKVGLIRPITLWPFPTNAIAEVTDRVKAFVSVELSMGQMIEDVRLASGCKKPVVLCNRSGGMIPTPEMVLETITKLAKEND